MAIRRRQMRPSNKHIASMAACSGPKRLKTAQFAQQGRLLCRQDLPRPQDDCK